MRKTLFLTLVILILVAGGFFFYFEFWDTIKYRSLVTDIRSDEVVQIIYSAPAPSPDLEGEGTTLENLIPVAPLYTEEEKGILAVSTGEVAHFELRSELSGEHIADATSLKVATKDSRGWVETIEVVLQISPTGNQETSLAPWFVENAASIRAIRLPVEGGKVLTDNQLLSIFPKGSRWVFRPLLDTSKLPPLAQEYSFLAAKYHGGDFASVEQYISSGLANSYRKPVMLLGINRVSLEFNPFQEFSPLE